MTLSRVPFAHRALYALPLLLAAALFGAVDKPDGVEVAVAELANAVPDVPATIVAVDNGGRGTYPGFDTNIYPGDRAMRAWRADELYHWVGYYLPAPCHKDDSWSSKRASLEDMGWGLAVIYVGQQTWDRTPRNYETRYRTTVRTVSTPRRVKTTVMRNGRPSRKWVTRRIPVKRTIRTPYRVAVDPASRPLDECSANLVSGTRGSIEAADAIRRTAREGFPAGTIVFLDIERMERTPQAMRDYYRAWVRTVLADGRYRPGIYAHTHNAKRVYEDVKGEFVAAGVAAEPPFWIASERNFSPDKEPHEVGHTFAAVWQGRLDIQESRNGVRLPIDVNVAAVPYPSLPVIAD